MAETDVGADEQVDALAALLQTHTPGSSALCRTVAGVLLAAGYRPEFAVRAEVKDAVEDWFSDISLDDLFAVKGWTS